jgi:hypothetical protein
MRTPQTTPLRPIQGSTTSLSGTSTSTNVESADLVLRVVDSGVHPDQGDQRKALGISHLPW